MNKVEMHKKICEELIDLYERKNADYGESFAELRKEYPESICIRLTDKLNRLKKLTSDDHEQNVKDESVEDTLKDIANYAIMELVERSVEDRDSYLKKVEDTLNKKLNDEGFISVNDVRESLGYKVYHGDPGDVIGWVKAKNSVEHHGIKGQKWGKRQKEYKSILTAFYNYDFNKHIQNLQLVYNNTIEEQYEYHSYDISGQSWKDQVFEMAKYIYTFLDGVYSDDHGVSMFADMLLGRNALWIALDVVDHENHEIEYNMADPEEYDRITEF